MRDWTYELIYESGGQLDKGLVAVGDLTLYSGGYVALGGVMFAPGAEIDTVCGGMALKRLKGSRLLEVRAGSELHFFEFREVRLWCTRWYRHRAVGINAAGDIDASSPPHLPIGTRLKEALVTVIVACLLVYLLFIAIEAASTPSN